MDPGYIVLTFRVQQEGDQYVSVCEELGIASCGDTLEEAFAALEDAANVYLATLEDESELARVIVERGIPVYPGQPVDNGEIAVRARPHEYVSPYTVSLPLARVA